MPRRKDNTLWHISDIFYSLLAFPPERSHTLNSHCQHKQPISDLAAHMWSVVFVDSAKIHTHRMESGCGLQTSNRAFIFQIRNCVHGRSISQCYTFKRHQNTLPDKHNINKRECLFRKNVLPQTSRKREKTDHQMKPSSALLDQNNNLLLSLWFCLY